MSATHEKVVIVTGGSQGIGAGIVAAYRQQGWAVVAIARTIKPNQDDDILTIEADITEPAAADRIVRETLEKFGRVDTLVNNAGLYVGKPFTDYTPEEYWSVVGVNLTGFFMLTQRVIAAMLESGGGHVVNVTTTLVDNADSSSPSVLTSLTKGGVAAATRSLAIEYRVARHTGERCLTRRYPNARPRCRRIRRPGRSPAPRPRGPGERHRQGRSVSRVVALCHRGNRAHRWWPDRWSLTRRCNARGGPEAGPIARPGARELAPGSSHMTGLASIACWLRVTQLSVLSTIP